MYIGSRKNLREEGRLSPFVGCGGFPFFVLICWHRSGCEVMYLVYASLPIIDVSRFPSCVCPTVERRWYKYAKLVGLSNIHGGPNLGVRFQNII